MTLFWVSLVLMGLIGALIVALPLLRFREREEVAGEMINSMVYRDRLSELQNDLQEGRVNQGDFDQLKQELELTLLEDVEASRPDDRVRGSGGWLVAAVLLVLVPLVAIFLYVSEGYSPELDKWFASQQKMERILPQLLEGQYEVAEQENVGVDDLVRALQKRLQQNPQDDRSWYMLGASYLQLRKPEQGELAFRRAMNLEPQNPDYIMGYTQAALALNGGKLTEELWGNLNQLMKQDPDNPKPYMTLGMAFYQSGDLQDAIKVWEIYLSRDNVEPRAAELLTRSVASARREMEQVAEAPTPGPTAAASPEVKVTVQVDEAVKSEMQSGDVLFVYAKAVQGPPMPLAVVRQPIGQWPVTVTLSDAQAMTPAMTLSKFDKVVIQARVSRSGNAVPQTGDWIGPTSVVDVVPGKQDVNLVINSKMP